MKDINATQFEKVEISGTAVWIPAPEAIPRHKFVGRQDIISKTLAAWMRLPKLPPMNFRMYGPPGTGKNAIVYELGRILNKDIYIVNGNDEIGPDQIACSPVMKSNHSIEYVASPLLAAMLRGGICFFDEIGKAPQSALDPLASVLDERRSITSVPAGIHLKAHKEFLFCAALNEDEETGLGLPGFLDERTRPAIYVGYPNLREIEEILRTRLSGLSSDWVEALTSVSFKLHLSTRMIIKLLEYAYRLSKMNNGKSEKPSKEEIKKCLLSALPHIDKENEMQKLPKKSAKNQQKREKRPSGDGYGESIYSESKETVH